MLPNKEDPQPNSTQSLDQLCHVWIAPDGMIHVQNLIQPLAKVLCQFNPHDETMRIRSQTGGDSKTPLTGSPLTRS